MEHPTLLIQYDENRKTETSGIVEPLHQGFTLLYFLGTLRLAGIVIDMDVFEIVRNDLADGGIPRDEVSELEAPGAATP